MTAKDSTSIQRQRRTSSVSGGATGSSPCTGGGSGITGAATAVAAAMGINKDDAKGAGSGRIRNVFVVETAGETAGETAVLEGHSI